MEYDLDGGTTDNTISAPDVLDRASVSGKMPPGWEVSLTDDLVPFYTNTTTGEVRWDKPGAARQEVLEEVDADDTPGDTQHHDRAFDTAHPPASLPIANHSGNEMALKPPSTNIKSLWMQALQDVVLVVCAFGFCFWPGFVAFNNIGLVPRTQEDPKYESELRQWSLPPPCVLSEQRHPGRGAVCTSDLISLQMGALMTLLSIMNCCRTSRVGGRLIAFAVVVQVLFMAVEISFTQFTPAPEFVGDPSAVFGSCVPWESSSPRVLQTKTMSVCADRVSWAQNQVLVAPAPFAQSPGDVTAYPLQSPNWAEPDGTSLASKVLNAATVDDITVMISTVQTLLPVAYIIFPPAVPLDVTKCTAAVADLLCTHISPPCNASCTTGLPYPQMCNSLSVACNGLSWISQMGARLLPGGSARLSDSYRSVAGLTPIQQTLSDMILSSIVYTCADSLGLSIDYVFAGDVVDITAPLPTAASSIDAVELYQRTCYVDGSISQYMRPCLSQSLDNDPFGYEVEAKYDLGNDGQSCDTSQTIEAIRYWRSPDEPVNEDMRVQWGTVRLGLLLGLWGSVLLACVADTLLGLYSEDHQRVMVAVRNMQESDIHIIGGPVSTEVKRLLATNAELLVTGLVQIAVGFLAYLAGHSERSSVARAVAFHVTCMVAFGLFLEWAGWLPQRLDRKVKRDKQQYTENSNGWFRRLAAWYTAAFSISGGKYFYEKVFASEVLEQILRVATLISVSSTSDKTAILTMTWIIALNCLVTPPLHFISDERTRRVCILWWDVLLDIAWLTTGANLGATANTLLVLSLTVPMIMTANNMRAVATVIIHFQMERLQQQKKKKEKKRAEKHRPHNDVSSPTTSDPLGSAEDTVELTALSTDAIRVLSSSSLPSADVAATGAQETDATDVGNAPHHIENSSSGSYSHSKSDFSSWGRQNTLFAALPTAALSTSTEEKPVHKLQWKHMVAAVLIMLGGAALLVSTSVRLEQQSSVCEDEVGAEVWKRSKHVLLKDGFFAAPSCDFSVVTELDLSNQRFDAADWSKLALLTQLQVLNLRNNALTSYYDSSGQNVLSQLTLLEELDLSQNALPYLAADLKLPALRVLRVDSNPVLSDVDPLLFVSSQLSISLQDTAFATSIQWRGRTEVVGEVFQALFGQVPSVLSRAVNASLRLLDLSACGITAVPFLFMHSMQQLKDVYLSHNNIQNLTTGSIPFTAPPVTLRLLNLSRSGVQTVDSGIRFDRLQNADTLVLDFSHNRLYAFPPNLLVYPGPLLIEGNAPIVLDANSVPSLPLWTRDISSRVQFMTVYGVPMNASYWTQLFDWTQMKDLSRINFGFTVTDNNGTMDPEFFTAMATSTANVTHVRMEWTSATAAPKLSTAWPLEELVVLNTFNISNLLSVSQVKAVKTLEIHQSSRVGLTNPFSDADMDTIGQFTGVTYLVVRRYEAPRLDCPFKLRCSDFFNVTTINITKLSALTEVTHLEVNGLYAPLIDIYHAFPKVKTMNLAACLLGLLPPELTLFGSTLESLQLGFIDVSTGFPSFLNVTSLPRLKYLEMQNFIVNNTQADPKAELKEQIDRLFHPNNVTVLLKGPPSTLPYLDTLGITPLRFAA